MIEGEYYVVTYNHKTPVDLFGVDLVCTVTVNSDGKQAWKIIEAWSGTPINRLWKDSWFPLEHGKKPRKLKDNDMDHHSMYLKRMGII